MNFLRFFVAAVLAVVLFSCAVACGDRGQGSSETTDPGLDIVSSEDTEVVTEPGNDIVSVEETLCPLPPEESRIETKAEDDETADPVAIRPAEDVRVVSFNLDANEATINQRAKPLINLILSFSPDSIGVQEARGAWVSRLKRHLVSEGYTRVGVDAGGSPDAVGGHFATYIFYRSDKYDLVASGTFWLSKTPDVPSIYDQTVDCNRTCTWALLENRETGFRYVHMNAHLDWMNMDVNAVQVQMIREQMERFAAMGYPVFATGDYNCDEGSRSYEVMVDSEIADDSKHVAETTMDLGTYPSYGRYDVTVEKPIDYVFVTGDRMTVHEYKVIDERPDGNYVSDHNGLFVHATVEAMPVIRDAALAPQFDAPVLSEVSATTQQASLRLSQAYDANGVMAACYRVVYRSSDGTTQELTVSSDVLTLTETDTFLHLSPPLSDGETYTIQITPISILGTEGETWETAYTFHAQLPEGAPVLSEILSAPAILDLCIADGRPTDLSANRMAVETVGSPMVDHGAMVFQKNGNYKIPGIKDHYDELADGFAVEIVLTTGEVTTYQNPVANYHAGGFGFDIENGELQFCVRMGGQYVSASTPIQAGQTYRFVGIYRAEDHTIWLYQNNQPVAHAMGTTAMEFPTHAGAMYLCIGGDSDATGQGEYLFEGSVGIVRIYGT